MDTGRTNYLRPFLHDVGRAASAVGRAVGIGKKDSPKLPPTAPMDYGEGSRSSEPAHGSYEHNSPARPL